MITQRCPECGMQIPLGAHRCPFCHEEFYNGRRATSDGSKYMMIFGIIFMAAGFPISLLDEDPSIVPIIIFGIVGGILFAAGLFRL